MTFLLILKNWSENNKFTWNMFVTTKMRKGNVFNCQWLIKDFTDRGCQLLFWGKNVLFGNIFTEKCMKMKEIQSRGGVRPCPPFGSASDCVCLSFCLSMVKGVPCTGKHHPPPHPFVRGPAPAHWLKYFLVCINVFTLLAIDGWWVLAFDEQAYQ